MNFTDNMVLVCTGRDTARAAGSGLKVLHLCLGVTENGALRRTQLPTAKARSYLGLCDLPRQLQTVNAPRIAADLTYEAKRTEALGVFADFERDVPVCRELLAAIDKALFEADIPFYVPIASRQAVQHATLTVDTAISGGSLTERVSSLQGMYGAKRIAAFLHPVSSDFVLPSETPDGTVLSPEERQSLLNRTGSQTFFSRELCAKYFTYTDENSRAHFVLFDDDTTMQAKLAQLSGCGVRTVFALYPDAERLLNLP